MAKPLEKTKVYSRVMRLHEIMSMGDANERLHEMITELGRSNCRYWHNKHNEDLADLAANLICPPKRTERRKELDVIEI